mgnify:CR=1 FL=1
MNIKSQIKTQYDYSLSHKGKTIGSALGIIAGLSYGLSGKKDNWVLVGLAVGGMVGGAIVGGLFDKKPEIVIADDTNIEKSNATGVGSRLAKNVGCPAGLIWCKFTQSCTTPVHCF